MKNKGVSLLGGAFIGEFTVITNMHNNTVNQLNTTTVKFSDKRNNSITFLTKSCKFG